jgi:exodeoxyribonuclease-1
MNIVFYDLETTGRSPHWDQIIQIAAIYTDQNLNVLDKININCRLNSFCIPEPEALLVNRMPIKNILNSNLSHHQLITEVYNKFTSWSPAIFIGYNSIKFDEEFLRNALFRNLYDPYLTIKNNNLRSDLLDTARISNFFFPEKLKSLINERGFPVLKLESLASINDIKNFTAHDALGDTYATLEIAKKIKEKIPSIWEKSTRGMDKITLQDEIRSRPFCHLESFFGKTKAFCLSYIGDHPNYKWALCFDLKEDPKEVLSMSSSELSNYLSKSPKVIRNIKLNKSPILLSIDFKKTLDSYKNISNELINERDKFIKTSTDFREKIYSYYNNSFDNNTLQNQEDVFTEETIYKKFLDNYDNTLLREFYNCNWQDRANLIKRFKDERLIYLAELLLYEEKPELLDKKKVKKIQSHISNRLLSKNKEKWLTIYDAYKKIDDLREKYANTDNIENIKILDELNSYIEYIEKKLQ